MGQRKKSGKLGCLSWFVVAAILIAVTDGILNEVKDSGGATLFLLIAIGIVVVLLFHFMGAPSEFRLIKEAERQRIRRSALKQQARSELIRDEFPELKRQSQRQARPPIPGHIQHVVFERDGGCCVLCGSGEDLQFDHIVPYSKGGGDIVENLRILCRSCNLRKSNRFV